jgi:ribonucleoside-triphosphate reductase
MDKRFTAASQIKKRDGRFAPFESDKIKMAIWKAGQATGQFGEVTAGTLSMLVLEKIAKLQLESTIDVEKVQDIVEEVLFESGYLKTTKAYILYREQRTHNRILARQGHSELMDAYLKDIDWKVRENSNMGFSLQGLNNYIASAITGRYWLQNIYTPEIREAHERGDFHIHDLNLLSVYCVGWDLKDLLESGFRGISGNVESAPPRHLRSALGQLVNFFYTLQGEAAGA